MSSALKHELANHIYRYLCHEAQYSDLPEAARESLTAASECIEQAYKLNVNNHPTSSSGGSSNTTQQHTNNTNSSNSTTTNHKSSSDSGSKSNPNTNSPNSPPVILPDDLLKIFTRHKEYLLSQQIDKNEQERSGSSSQHPISQLPMTTRKKLSHLRAQIKRQASKAARSRLEKRSSVSGTGSANDRGGSSSSHHFGLGMSFDTANIKQHPFDGHDTHHEESNHHQANHSTTSSNEPSPTAIAFSSNPTTSSPAGANQPGSTLNSSSGNHQETNSHLPPGQQQHNESGASSSGGAGGPAGGATSGGKHLAVPRSGHHRHKEFGVSVHQKNFKQKLIALLKKFRTDGSGFDSEEQYREALERELMKAAAGRGSRAIEELLEEEIDVEEEGSGSELEDWDNISESSTPKPSLRPFFSSTTLDKI